MDDEIPSEHVKTEISSPDSPATAKAFAKRFQELRVLRPELLRTTRASKALDHCGSALRVDCIEDLYWKSSMSSSISTFWSHSWHGDHRKKILTLLVLYNGRAAVSCGFFTALISMILFLFGGLPGLRRNERLEQASTWSLASGTVAASFALILWRSKERVFLDRICINQKDPDLKKKSIWSLPGLLKKSDKMLALWDDTWGERLWCLFELAAFLRSKAESEQKLDIKPTLIGPCCVAGFLTVFAIAVPFNTVPSNGQTRGVAVYVWLTLLGNVFGFLAVWALRRYFASVLALQEQLRSVSFERIRCQCCDLNHQWNGQELLCDREVVKACVVAWFGSQESFEESIRAEVSDAVVFDLQHHVFTRRRTCAVTSPLFWAFLDLSASWARVGGAGPELHEHFTRAASAAVEGLSFWLLVCPILVEYVVYLSRRFCRQATSPMREAFCNLGVLIMVLPLQALLFGCYWVLFRLNLPRLVISGVFAGEMLLVTAISSFIKVKAAKAAKASSASNGESTSNI